MSLNRRRARNAEPMTLNQGNRNGRRREEVLKEQDAIELVELQIFFRGVACPRNGSHRGRSEKDGAEDRRLKVRWTGSRQVLIADVHRFLQERHRVRRGAGDYERGAVWQNFLRRGADEERKAQQKGDSNSGDGWALHDFSISFGRQRYQSTGISTFRRATVSLPLFQTHGEISLSNEKPISMASKPATLVGCHGRRGWI